MWDKVKELADKAKNAASTVATHVGDLNGDGKIDEEDLKLAVEWAQKKGSSGNSGESRSDLQEKVIVVPEPIGHPLDNFDLVIYPFEDACVQRPYTVVDYAVKVGA